VAILGKENRSLNSQCQLICRLEKRFKAIISRVLQALQMNATPVVNLEESSMNEGSRDKRVSAIVWAWAMVGFAAS
jgi:type VI protein secretion system component VasA